MVRLLALFACLLVSTSASAIGPQWPITDIPRFWLLGEGNAHFSVDGFYFRTADNYNESGIVDSPARMEHVHWGNARFNVAFGFAPTVTLFAQADARTVFAVNAKTTNIPDAENYGMGDAFVALRWLVWRTATANKYYPTEWAPESWVFVVEPSWLFPLYDRAGQNQPPLGDHSNDFTMLGRLAWYANEWFSLSAGGGYTHRTSGYLPSIPWNLRADFLTSTQRLRFWAELGSHEIVGTSTNIVNPNQLDAFQAGSLLFKSEAPTLRTATLGSGYLLSPRWEIAAGAMFTASGRNAAKGFGAMFGLAYRPYQVPELKYEEYHIEKQKKVAREKREYISRKVVAYGIKGTILKVSKEGNFFKIGYGLNDGLKVGDNFQVLPPDDFSGRPQQPKAFAKVEVVRMSDSFLRVQQRSSPGTQIKAGDQAQHVTVAE